MRTKNEDQGLEREDRMRLYIPIGMFLDYFWHFSCVELLHFLSFCLHFYRHSSACVFSLLFPPSSPALYFSVIQFLHPLLHDSLILFFNLLLGQCLMPSTLWSFSTQIYFPFYFPHHDNLCHFVNFTVSTFCKISFLFLSTRLRLCQSPSPILFTEIKIAFIVFIWNVLWFCNTDYTIDCIVLFVVNSWVIEGGGKRDEDINPYTWQYTYWLHISPHILFPTVVNFGHLRKVMAASCSAQLQEMSFLKRAEGKTRI